MLKKAFFNRDSFLVASELIGCSLCRKNEDGGLIKSIISEIEIYDGFKDKASHAFKGITERNKVMFGSPGVLYVYLCYGIHNLMNVVTREKKYPAALLIRSVVNCEGPSRLTKYFNINLSHNKLSLSKKNGIWIEKRNSTKDYSIIKMPRIGVAYAGKPWSGKLYRYKLK